MSELANVFSKNNINFVRLFIFNDKIEIKMITKYICYHQ